MIKKLRFLPAEITLSQPKEGEAPAIAPMVQILRTGSFSHPEYGAFEITKEHLESFVKNFGERVRGIDIAVDYEHKSDSVAAGWFEELKLEEQADGKTALLARVKWTPTAAKVLADREFRYLSADFTLAYKDNESGKDFGPTLLGAGLTNRPFVKGMEPVVQLNEKEKGEEPMTEAEKKAFDEMKAKSDAAEKELAELKAANAKRDEEAKKEKALAEKKGKFDKMLSEKKVVEAQREAFMADDFAKFAELAQPAPKEERTSSSEDGEGDETPAEGDAEEKILALADKLVSEKKAADQNEAIRIVLKDPAHKALVEERNKKYA